MLDNVGAGNNEYTFTKPQLAGWGLGLTAAGVVAGITIDDAWKADRDRRRQLEHPAVPLVFAGVVPAPAQQSGHPARNPSATPRPASDYGRRDTAYGHHPTDIPLAAPHPTAQRPARE